MDFFQICETAITLLPKLEPMAGASLAIGLAYLNLERFRYRQRIREGAGQQLNELKQKDHFGLIEDLDQIKLLAALAALSNNNRPNEHKKSKRIRLTQGGPWAAVYKVLFSWHVDRYVALGGVALAVVALFFGVAFSVDAHRYACPLFNTAGLIKIWLWLLSAGIVLPLLFVFTGNRIVTALQNKSDQAYAQMAKLIACMAPAELPPVTAQQPAPNETPQ